MKTLSILVLPMRSEFYTACKLGNEEQLSHLVKTHGDELARGSNFSSVINLPINREGQTMLHVASIHGQSQLIPYLLSIGSDPAVG